MMELRLSVTAAGLFVVERRVAVTPQASFAFAEWNAARVDNLEQTLDALSDYEGPLYVSVDLRSAPQLSSALQFVLERRPDAVVLLRQARRSVASQPLSIPLRVAVLEADGVSLREPPPIIRDWVLVHPFDVDSLVDLLQDWTAEPPHVLHLTAGAHLPGIIAALASLQAMPMLIVLEALDDRVDNDALVGSLQELGDAGCPTVFVLTGDRRQALTEGVARMYANIARAVLDPFTVGRELVMAGCKVMLLVEESFEERLALAPVEPFVRARLATVAKWVVPEARSELEAHYIAELERTEKEIARIAGGVEHVDPFESFGAGGRPSLSALVAANADVDKALLAAAPAHGWLRKQTLDEPSDASALPPRELRCKLHRGGVEVMHGATAGETLQLDVSIGFLRDRALKVAIPSEVLASAFGGDDAIDVDVVVWCPSEEVRVSNVTTSRMRLPRMGESKAVQFALDILALPPNRLRLTRRLRVAAYCKNRVLQSMVVNLDVATSVELALAAAPPSLALDYVSSDQLVRADLGPECRLSIFANDAGDGTHWLGVRAVGGTQEVLLTLGPEKAKALTTNVRNVLREAGSVQEGGNEAESDMYALSFAETAGEDRALRQQGLLKLAQAGRRLYTSLFAKKLRAAMAPPNANVEIARCSVNAPALPWQLVYDFVLDEEADATRLCPSYVKQIEDRNDLLDQPEVCAKQASCPHRTTFLGAEPDRDARSVVCPFGFWGTRHRIAQPLALRREQPREPARIVTPPRPGGARSVSAIYYEFENAAGHLDRIHAEVTAVGGSCERTKSKGELASLLRQRSAVVYFYCHGDDDGVDFYLRIGADGEVPPQRISAQYIQDCLPESFGYGPIVILNGCETLRVQPSAANELLPTLRELGVAAVIGPEIEMFTPSAAAVGERVVVGVLGGKPLDQVMVDVRRHLLREMNPMGLAYNVYAPVGLVWTPKQEASDETGIHAS